jgi:hypothetical protein
MAIEFVLPEGYVRPEEGLDRIYLCSSNGTVTSTHERIKRHITLGHNDLVGVFTAHQAMLELVVVHSV